MGAMDTLVDASVLLSMLGNEFAVAVAKPELRTNELFPEEQQYIANAVSKRRAEFATARICARQALAQIGVTPRPLVPQADRSPYWPPGIRGSITHTTGCCAVVVTDSPSILAVGIDVEADSPLEADLESLICVAAERSWLSRVNGSERSALLKLIFSAKESFYKCQYTRTKSWLNFVDVQLNIDLSSRRFEIADVFNDRPSSSFARSVQGKFRWTRGFIVTTAVCTTRSPPG